MATDAVVLDAARSVERLRLAESQLARRRQTACGPSENARAAMRLILERSDAGVDLTPGEIADHLSISPASVSGILDRLHTGGLITFSPNEKDRRSKLVNPVDRSVDIEDIDPLTARIRDMSVGLSGDDVRLIAEFIEGIADAVDDECR